MAIIGILVAVSIPIFSAQVKKARIATNKADIRATKAAAVSQLYQDLTDAKKYNQHSWYDYKHGLVRRNADYDSSRNKVNY